MGPVPRPAPTLSIDTAQVAQLLVLIVAANAGPVLAWRVLGARLGTPLDRGRVLGDGHRLLGADKTLRGVVAGIGAGAVAGALLGLGAGLGALFGLWAMVGDLCASFLKRRLGLAAGTSALGLDQVPESLLPLLVLREALAADGVTIAAAVLAFLVFERSVSPLLRRLGIRRRPGPGGAA
ncbi:MAG: CDP-archaeol synthase [Ectothiorhodospiraceae bacterium]|nr:CDP-archaeol synthase [Ectothiorhodospiraceae bacterium]